MEMFSPINATEWIQVQYIGHYIRDDTRVDCQATSRHEEQRVLDVGGLGRIKEMNPPPTKPCKLVPLRGETSSTNTFWDANIKG